MSNPNEMKKYLISRRDSLQAVHAGALGDAIMRKWKVVLVHAATRDQPYPISRQVHRPADLLLEVADGHFRVGDFDLVRRCPAGGRALHDDLHFESI